MIFENYFFLILNVLLLKVKSVMKKLAIVSRFIHNFQEFVIKSTGDCSVTIICQLFDICQADYEQFIAVCFTVDRQFFRAVDPQMPGIYLTIVRHSF